MKRNRKPYPYLKPWPQPGTLLMIQAPLPNLVHTLPILLSTHGHRSEWQDLSPLAPPEEPANDKP